MKIAVALIAGILALTGIAVKVTEVLESSASVTHENLSYAPLNMHTDAKPVRQPVPVKR